jgi:hypothetical protein
MLTCVQVQKYASITELLNVHVNILRFMPAKLDRAATFRDTCVTIRIRVPREPPVKKSVNGRDPEQPSDAG